MWCGAVACRDVPCSAARIRRAQATRKTTLRGGQSWLNLPRCLQCATDQTLHKESTSNRSHQPVRDLIPRPDEGYCLALPIARVGIAASMFWPALRSIVPGTALTAVHEVNGDEQDLLHGFRCPPLVHATTRADTFLLASASGQGSNFRLQGEATRVHRLGPSHNAENHTSRSGHAKLKIVFTSLRACI